MEMEHQDAQEGVEELSSLITDPEQSLDATALTSCWKKQSMKKQHGVPQNEQTLRHRKNVNKTKETC